MNDQHLSAVENERGMLYGPVRRNHECIGMTWAGIIRQSGWTPESFDPMPADLVCLLMTAVKVVRAATPAPYHPDNFIDGGNYLKFADRLQREDASNV